MAEFTHVKTQPRDKFGSAKRAGCESRACCPASSMDTRKKSSASRCRVKTSSAIVRKGAHIVDLEYNGKTEKARLRELQWDHLGKELIHVDFMRVSQDERIVIGVRIELRGTAPGIAEGGVLDQPIHLLQVECPALEIPDHIRVNVDKLKIGDSIHVRELTLPANVVAKADPDAVVVS